MGNAASVTVANITAHCELSPIFSNHDEIMFHVRFVDDGFMAIDCTDIIDIDGLKQYLITVH